MQELIDNVKIKYEELDQSLQPLKKLLIGRDVIIHIPRKREGRWAQIDDVFQWNGEVVCHLNIYRIDNRQGFKGREQFLEYDQDLSLRLNQFEFVDPIENIK